MIDAIIKYVGGFFYILTYLAVLMEFGVAASGIFLIASFVLAVMVKIAF